ncbi:PDZ domain-containing protein [Aeromicrobium ginsengisoli]|uniref:endopeptidase La n=1 Tax=Aeromicrobium ginsengisoli TaxID=363867 RepID=A0A5M4FG68_9ACTN|nr:PDZ domain-containing protein [Aeromicrobium ginsengisoli]
MSARYTTMVVAALSLIVLTSVAFMVPVPYVTMSPGEPFNTLGSYKTTQGKLKPMFTFGAGVKTYRTSGALYFTTVSVRRADRPLSLAGAVKAYIDPNKAVVPKDLIYPDNETAEQSTAESAAQMAGSKDSSSVAALRAAGYKVGERPSVVQVVKGGAAFGKLVVDDVFLDVDGTKVTTPDQVVKAVGTHKPGETVRLTVERRGKRVVVPVVTRADPKDKNVPRIGISIGVKYTYPITVTNNVDSRIGGPSAGTMFALAIYDKLTPGELTGGRKIAGTGEIADDGTVAPIGGVRQKMAGAADKGATIFLVPAANCAEATDGDDDGLKLVKISNLKDAISSLEALAKNPDAKVPSCS